MGQCFHDTNLPSYQFVKTIKTAGCQCILLVNGIMNRDNASKEMVKLFIDLTNMGKGLVDENQQPQQELEKLFPSTRGGGRGDESRELHYRVGTAESSASLQQLIQIQVLQHRLPLNGQLQKYGERKLVENPSKFAFFFI